MEEDLNLLVALVLEVLLVALILEEGVGVVLADPLGFVDIKGALGLDLLPLPTTRNRDGKTWRSKGWKEREEKVKEGPQRGPRLSPKFFVDPLTRVVLELLGLAVLGGADEVPDEAFDVLIASVVEKTVDQDGPADGLHVPLGKTALESSVGQDLPPSAPAGGGGRRSMAGEVRGVSHHLPTAISTKELLLVATREELGLVLVKSPVQSSGGGCHHSTSWSLSTLVQASARGCHQSTPRAGPSPFSPPRTSSWLPPDHT